MNLFLAALNVPMEYFSKASEGLNHIFDIFPNLRDGQKFIYKSEDSRNFILMLHESVGLLGKRNYVSQDKGNIVFYSGLPVDPSRKVNAHRAEELLKNFDTIKYDLYGQVSFVRFNKLTSGVDIITDTVGMEQVYYYNDNNSFIFSNSIYLIEKVTGSYQLDYEGMSYYLSFGWIASDCTLRKEIKVINGGQHWTWDYRNHRINKKTYFDASNIKINTKEALNNNSIEKLSQKISDCYSVIHENFDLECPLTGGLDSRLAAAFLIHNNIRAVYYTSGNLFNQDVQIASLIAKTFNLDYKVFQIDDNLLTKEWDNFVRIFLLQNDGLTSLWNITSILTHFEKQDRMKVRIATQGAEVAKIEPGLMQNSLEMKPISEYLIQKIKNKGNLIKDQAIQISREYIAKFTSNYLDKSVDIRIILGLFSINENLGRSHANNWNIIRSIADHFNVFICKDFLSSAMKIDPLSKITFPLHYKLMRQLNKELTEIPFYSSSGRRKFGIQNIKTRIYTDKAKEMIKKQIKRNKPINVVGFKNELHNKTVPSFSRQSWFENKLNDIRSVILDQTSSDIWLVLNRNEVQKNLYIKSFNTINGEDLSKLYIIASLFYYEYFNKQR